MVQRRLGLVSPQSPIGETEGDGPLLGPATIPPAHLVSSRVDSLPLSHLGSVSSGTVWEVPKTQTSTRWMARGPGRALEGEGEARELLFQQRGPEGLPWGPCRPSCQPSRCSSGA